jgi:large conductance mechanosensitive channel
MLKEFRDFVLRGNVIELAVAFILGAAFTVVVRSFADDVLMPPVGLLFGDLDFRDFFVVMKEGATPGPYASLQAAKDAGAVVWAYGLFITAVITFVITAFALFLVIKAAKRVQERQKEAPAAAAPTTKKCPFCMSDVNISATRCAFCTSQIPAAGSS